MVKVIPNYRGRTAHAIITENVRNESSGYIYRALSWLDIARREKSSPAFQYGAHDTRQGIEQLLFEELVLSTGANLDRLQYQKCLENRTKLCTIINRLSPDREKLGKFVQIVMTTGNPALDLMVWDHKLLMKYWGAVSDYLHWAGAIDETLNKWSWVEAGIAKTEEACMYIWKNQTEKKTGFMSPSDMHQEIAALWERFKAGSIGTEEVKIACELLQPELRRYPKKQFKHGPFYRNRLFPGYQELAGLLVNGYLWFSASVCGRVAWGG